MTYNKIGKILATKYKQDYTWILTRECFIANARLSPSVSLL